MHGGVLPRIQILTVGAAFPLHAEPVDLLGEVGYDPTISNLHQQPNPISNPPNIRDGRTEARSALPRRRHPWRLRIRSCAFSWNTGRALIN
jgi:hypothetical protein